MAIKVVGSHILVLHEKEVERLSVDSERNRVIELKAQPLEPFDVLGVLRPDHVLKPSVVLEHGVYIRLAMPEKGLADLGETIGREHPRIAHQVLPAAHPKDRDELIPEDHCVSDLGCSKAPQEGLLSGRI